MELQAPAVAQRLGGTARDLVRQVPVAELRDGRLDPLTGAIESGLTILLRGLERRHGGFAVETSTRCIIELLQFKRRGAESIDEALSRFETCRMQTQTQAVGFDLPIPVVAWLLLEALRVPRASWRSDSLEQSVAHRRPRSAGIDGEYQTPGPYCRAPHSRQLQLEQVISC